MAKGKVGLSTGKKVKRVVTQGRSGGFKRAKPRGANFSNTYGIKPGGTGDNLAKPGGLKGAVTQGMPGNKHSVAKAKRKIRGS